MRVAVRVAVRVADQEVYARALHRHHLPGAQLGATPPFLLPVDLHLAGSDELLGRAAARRQAGGLEQRVQRDVLAAQGEVDAIHEDTARSPTIGRMNFSIPPVSARTERRR